MPQTQTPASGQISKLMAYCITRLRLILANNNPISPINNANSVSVSCSATASITIKFPAVRAIGLDGSNGAPWWRNSGDSICTCYSSKSLVRSELAFRSGL